MVKAGNLRILAMTSPKRVETFPDVPSVMETFPDLITGGGLPLLGPAGMEPEVVTRINREIDAAVKSGEFGKRVAEFGWANKDGASAPKEVVEYIRVQRERWAKVVKDLGLQPK
ncbi:MAG: Bug family tripartite tricarboxylate transporter substrate binding protein [Burkholderiales bacterium]